MQNLVKLQVLEFGNAASAGSEAAIKELRTTIPAPILAHYDRMTVRGKKGVAEVRNGVCRECHMQVAIGVMQMIRQGHDIQLCGNCGRYLYLEETPTQEPPAKPVVPAKPKRKRRKSAALDAA